MGQEYDGRATDAWALGIILYGLMEQRLPFDTPINARRPVPQKHRIARCEWQWYRYGDVNGEFDEEKGKDMIGAKNVVEGLVAKLRSRWSLDKVADTDWVKGGIDVPGGLKRPYDDDEKAV